MSDPIFIDNDSDLAHACAIWSECPIIGVDTEFERTRTYYARPALVQIFDGRRASLIDPLAVEDFTPLARVLARAETLKVMHAAEGDVEVLEQLTGVVPRPLFDTQIAAALAGHGFSLGYRKLTGMLEGVELAKGETRSNWLKRPLAEAQVAYAVLDVLHLLSLCRRLRSDLAELGRDAWLDEESARLEHRRRMDRDPRRAYLRIRAPGNFEVEQLSALRELAAWREREARARDVPRRTVLDDSCLLRIASALPPDTAALATHTELPQKVLTRYGDAIVDAVAGARAAAEQSPPLQRPLLERRHGAWLKTLKEVVREQAAALGLAEPVLAQSRTLEAMVQAAVENRAQLPEELRGWRRAVIGEPLMTTLEALARER